MHRALGDLPAGIEALHALAGPSRTIICREKFNDCSTRSSEQGRRLPQKLDKWLPITHENTHRWHTKNAPLVLLPMLPQAKKNNHKFPPEGIRVRFPPQGIHVCCAPRHGAAVTARNTVFTTGDKRVLVSTNIIRVGYKRYVGGSLPGTLRQLLLPCKKKERLPTAHFCHPYFTLTGNTHPWFYTTHRNPQLLKAGCISLGG